MRTRYHTNGPAWRTNLFEPAPPQPEPTPEPEMPRGQMIHILTVRVRTAGADSLFAKALNCLRAVGSDEPDAADRTTLRASGYMKFDEVIQRDVLLPAGHWKAGDIARAVAKQYEIHEITFRFKSERSNMGSSASCSCQGWNQIVSRKRGDDDRLRRCASEHLDAVKRGTWKRPRPLPARPRRFRRLRDGRGPNTSDIFRSSDMRRTLRARGRTSRMAAISVCRCDF